MDDSRARARATAARATGAVSRRTLLKALGAGLVLTACGGPDLSGTARTARSFDLRQPSYDLFAERNRRLHERHRVMQSFTFDNVNQRLFVAQLQNGTPGDDLCVSELSLGGDLLGHMHLDGAGHGVSIGVEPVGDRSFLWVEALSDRPDPKGRGTALQRFEFRDDTTPTDPQLHLQGSTRITCATDATHERLLVRRRVGEETVYTTHLLSAAAEGDFDEPLTRTVEPEIDGTFQGYAFHGRFLYVLVGDGHADPADIDSRLSCIDLTTGAVTQDAVLTRAGSSLPWREPEGMAVQRTADGRFRLCFGLGAHDRLGGSLRFANVFYKDVLAG